MIAALTPALALLFLAELEPATRALAIVATDGTLLAGDPSLPSRPGCLTARSARHVVIARVPPGGCEALLHHDLEAVARALG